MREKIKNVCQKTLEKLTKKEKIFVCINAALFLTVGLFILIFVQSWSVTGISFAIMAAVVAVFSLLYFFTKRNATVKKRVWSTVLAVVLMLVSCWSIYYYRAYGISYKNLYSRGEKLDTVEEIEEAYEKGYSNLFMVLEKDNFSETPYSYMVEWRIENDDGTTETVKNETIHRYYILRFGTEYFVARVQPDYLDEYFGDGAEKYRRVKLQKFGNIDSINYEEFVESAYEYIYAYPELGDEVKEDDDYELTPGGKYEWIHKIYGDLPEVSLHDTFTIIIEDDGTAFQQTLWPTALFCFFASLVGAIQILLVEKKKETEHVNPFLRDKKNNKPKKHKK